jgi:hypothetical protein
MLPETLFSHASTAAMLGWAALIFGPRRFGWFNPIALWIIPSGLALVYGMIVLRHFAGVDGGFDSLRNVAKLMADDWVLLAGWVHFLAFDLFVGAIMALRMDRIGVSRLVQGPILFAIFMFGPFGFLIAALTEIALRAVLSLQDRLSGGARHVAA